MKTTRFLASLMLATTLSSGAFAALSAKSEDFIKKATIGNQFEIDSSNVALDRSTDAEVRDYAKQMVKDHQMALKDLGEAAPSDSLPASTELDAAHEKQLDALRKVSDKQFDAAYIKAQTKAHDETVALFSSYAAKGDEPELKAYAAAKLPRLKQHQAHVKSFKMTKDGYHATHAMPKSTAEMKRPGEKPMAVQR